MPYNDAYDVFLNPPELKRFESLPPQVVQRINSINSAVNNIVKLEPVYSVVVNQEPRVATNPIIEQINKSQSIDVNSARSTLEDAYGEVA